MAKAKFFLDTRRRTFVTPRTCRVATASSRELQPPAGRWRDKLVRFISQRLKKSLMSAVSFTELYYLCAINESCGRVRRELE